MLFVFILYVFNIHYVFVFMFLGIWLNICKFLYDFLYEISCLCMTICMYVFVQKYVSILCALVIVLFCVIMCLLDFVYCYLLVCASEWLPMYFFNMIDFFWMYLWIFCATLFFTNLFKFMGLSIILKKYIGNHSEAQTSR